MVPCRNRIWTVVVPQGLILLCLTLLSPGLCPGQLPGDKVPDAAAHQRAFEELAKDVAALQARNNILKKVIRLLQPSVVHIEVRKNTGSRTPGLEEAGSGVIIEFDKKHYILTNRHVITNAELANICLLYTSPSPRD